MTCLSLLLLMLGQAPEAPAAAPTPTPLRWGVDDAGGPPNAETLPWLGDAFEDLGINLWVVHARDAHRVAEKLELIRRVDAWCDVRGIDWICNIEGPNWIAEHVDDQGRDWYNREDGRHFGLYPDDILAEYGRAKRLLGIMYDEAAHMQNCRNMILNNMVPFKPWIYDPGDDTLEKAADHFTEAVAEVAQRHEKHGIPLYTEHVFPVLYHAFARAGWTPCSKILKEGWTPVYAAMTLGAALQYETEFWLTPDLWGLGDYPGHSLDEYRSALLVAYHLGADCIYTENLAFDHEQAGKGSLILVTGEEGYRLTDYGRATGDFIKNYVPAHPRHYRFQDVRPRVAIVRQPDACWGQKGSWLGDRLFGNDAWPTNAQTEGRLHIWSLLTRGVIPREGLSWNGGGPYVGRPFQVFVPLDGVIEFDHHVTAPRLDGVEVIFLTGVGVTPETQGYVGECVRQGATCVAFPHLLPEAVRAQTGDNGKLNDGAGLWMATTDFLSEAVRECVAHVIPEEDIIRYRFGDTVVTFHPTDGDPNRLAVTVAPAE